MTDALEGERTLTMPIGSLDSVRGAVSWSGGNGWTRATGTDILYNETYFDLSAYTRDALTIFPIAASLQDPGRYLSNNPNVPMQVMDIISQVQLDPSEVNTWILANNVPGMLGTDVDFTQIIWGQYRTFLGQATFQGAGTEFLAANAASFGSGSPSTAERLWIYRFVVVPGSEDTNTLSIPASRVILSALVGEEKELAFLMRQKRSYELAK